MADDRLRELERRWREAGDPASEARWLQERFRTGALGARELELAARAGHAAAGLVVGGGLADEEPDLGALARFGHEAAVRAGVAAVRAVLPVWTSRLRDEDHLHELVEAVEDWLRGGGADGTRLTELALEVGAIPPGGWDAAAAAEAAFHAVRLALEPEQAPALLEGALAAAVSAARDRRSVQERVRDEVAAWALGREDPVRARPAAEGTRLGREPSMVRCASFAPDGRAVLASSAAGTVSLWDRDRRALLRRYPVQRSEVLAARLSADGSRVVWGDLEGRVAVWDTATGAQLRAFQAHGDMVNDVAFLPDGRRAVTVGHDRGVRLWDLEAGRELRAFRGHDRPVEAVAVGLEGRVLCSADHGGAIRLWDVAAGAALGTLSHEGAVQDLAASADGRLLLSASMDQTLALWDVARGELLWRRDGHGAAVYACALAGDGRLAASWGTDHRLRVWDARSGEEVHRWHAPWVTLAVGFSPDAGTLVTGGRNGALRLWQLPGRAP